MPFTEKSHAFIAARFYIRLTEAFSERGRKAFIHATQYYAGQRGRRMAQRAIRDGADLSRHYIHRFTDEEIDSLVRYWQS